MSISQTGLSLIKSFEGCRLKAYRDIRGVLTIGWGDTADVRPGMTITQAIADARLVDRLTDEFEPEVWDAIADAPTTQPQLDAMLSLSWNIGTTAFRHSSIARRHRQGDHQGAANAFLLYHLVNGRPVEALSRRRAAERRLYLSPL